MYIINLYLLCQDRIINNKYELIIEKYKIKIYNIIQIIYLFYNIFNYERIKKKETN